LYPFGYGLSYSRFQYSNLKLLPTEIRAGDALRVEVDVSNTSDRDGEEVVQVYLSYPRLAGAAIRALVGFTRIQVLKRDTQHVRMDLAARDLSSVNEEGMRITSAGGYRLSVGGGQPGTGAPVVESSFTIRQDHIWPK